MPMMSRVFDAALRGYNQQSRPNHEHDMFADLNFDHEQYMKDGPWV